MSVNRDPFAEQLARLEGEPVETLTDEDLQAELTVAAHDPVRRKQRFEALVGEAVKRQRTLATAGI